MTSIEGVTGMGRGYPLSREHHIPLRRQLAADLEAGIRDGHIVRGRVCLRHATWLGAWASTEAR